MNNNLSSNACPRCSEVETWSHVVQHRTLKDKNVQFMNELIRSLKPKAITNKQKMIIENIHSDLK